mgnify:FL=1
MNKIFKVIWSKARCCYIVASELANGNSKVGTSGAVRKARRSATGLCALQIALLSSFIAFAPMNDAFAAVEEITGMGNIVATTDTDGKAIITIKDDVTFTSVTAGTVTVGGTTINSSGISTNGKITGVMAGTANTDAVNYEQLTTTNTNVSNLTDRMGTAEGDIATNTTAISALDARMGTAESTLKYFKANSSGTSDDAVATGLDSIAIGKNANSIGVNSITMGKGAATNGAGAIAIGDTSNADEEDAIAIGKEAEALGVSSIAMGDGAQGRDVNAIALGTGADAKKEDSVAIGTASTTTGVGGVAVGKGTTAGVDGVALGTSTSAGGNAVALGNTSSATGSSAAMGNNAVAGGASTIAIGSGSRTAGANDIAMGTGAGVGTTGGDSANLQHDRIAIGTNAGQNGSGNENIALGYKAGNDVDGDGNVAIGSMAGTNVNGDYNTSIGYMANTEVDSSGNVISSIGSHTTAIGAHTIAVAGATAVGDRAKATGENSVAVGYGAKAEGGSAIAIGQTAQASDNSIALGDASFANQSISSGISYLTNVVAGSSGVVSVGSDTVKRRIVNVADGSEGNDAVNVNQLKAAQTKVAEFIGGNVTLAADGSYTSITLKDTSNVEHTYSTLAEAMGAVTTGQIEVATAGVVKYSDANQTNIILGDGTATGGATISKLKDATKADQAVNLGQMNTAIEASRIKYYSVNSTISANRDNSGAAGLNSMAIGPAAKAEGEQSISLGINTKSEGRNSIVIGNAESPTTTKQAVAYNESGIAIGTAASSRGEHSIAFGYYAETEPQNSDLTSHDAIAIGTKAQATADRAVALGKEAVASAKDAFAQGSNAAAQGEQSIAVGTDSNVEGPKSMAVGSKNTVDGASSGAFGTTMNGGNGAANNVAGDNTYVVGNANGTVSANNSSIIGNENKLGDSYLGTDGLRHGVPADKVGILGSDNKVTASESSVIGYNNTLGKEGTNTYNFAVKSGVMGSDNIVTGDGNRVIGNDNNDGDKSQVFILGNSVTAGLANSVYLGDSSSYVVAGTTTSGDQAYGSLTVGTTTYNFAGATPAGVVTVGGIGSERRIQNVAAGLVTAGSTDAVNGSQLYALTRPLKFKGDNSTVISRGSDEQLNIVGGANQANLSDNNIGVIGDGTTLNIKLAKDLTGLTSVTTGTTVMNNNGITMGGGVSLTTTDGLNNGGKTITNVAPGTAGTDAVNVNQLNTAATKATTTVSAGSNINVTPTTAADGHTEYNVKLKDTVTLGTGVNQVTMDGTTGTISAGTGTNQVVFNGVTGQGSVGKVNINGSVGRVGGLTNTDWGPGYTMVSGQAATEDQLQKATQGLTNAGLNFAGNTGSTNKKLGETMTIQGGYTGTAASDENVKTVVNTDGTMSIQLAKDAKFDSVTTGDTVINNNGLTIGTGATAIIINKGNINMGDNIIHGVADGVDGKDAVNKDQLDKAAAGSKTTVSAGSNIYVTKTDGADGEPDNYEVSLKDKITLGTTPENQVTIDGTTGTISAGANIAFNGVTGMGNIGNIKFDGSGSVGEISGLTNTTIVAGVTGEGTRAGVAATEGQLKALNNIIDGGLNFAGDDYVSTDSNTVINKKLGEQLNIIGGETTLASGGPAKNIKTAKNAAGDLEIILGSELELNKVTMGNTYLDENGLYFGGYGPTNVYLTKDGGLHNGGYTITGVGNGINDDDAVNMSQLKDATAVATTTVSDGKNTTVTSKLNDNGSTDYQVNLNDNSTLGSQDGTGNYVNINGTDGKIVVAGENGNKITIDGNKGEIGGLTNTDFVVGTTGEGDRAGVAATEGQLKDIYDNLDGKIEQNKTDITNLDNRVTKNEGDIANIQGDIEKIENRVTKVEGDTIKSGAIDENTGKISLERNDGTSFELEGTLSDESLQGGNDDGLGNYKADADGKVTMQVKDKYSGEERDVTIADVASKAKLDDLTGAVGVGSKDEMKDKYKDTNYIKDADDMAGADVILDKEIKNNSDRLDQQGDQINNLNNSVNRLGNRVDKVGAGAAALAALHPLDFDPDEKLTFAAGVGNYRGETAASIGAFYRPDEKVMLSLGGTVGNGENMVNMGVSFALDRTSNVNNSKVALAKEVVDLRKQVADLTLLVMQNVGQGRENLDVNRLFPDVAENHWAYEYVADLAKQGIIEGYPDGNFGGDRMMTRYEFAAMLYRAMEKGANVDSKIINEFEAELGRIRVDRISGQDDDKHKVERVRVNGGKTRDKYGSEIAAQ